MKFLRNTLITLIALVAISACDTTKIENAIDDFAVVIGLEPINTSVSVIITDAATGELVNTEITTEFTGTNGSDVVDLYSDPLSSVEVNSGILNFGISNNVVPNEGNPASVTLRFPAQNGYLAKNQTVEVSELGQNNFTVSLIRRSNAPTGVVVKDETVGSTNANGSTTQELNVGITSTSTATNEETGASFNLPAGSVLLASDGSPLTGTLSTEAIYYNADEPEAVNAVPAELLANVGDSVLTMLGAAEIIIKDSNNKEATSVQTSASKMNATVTNTGEYIVGFILNSTSYAELQQLLRLAYISPSTAERFIIYSVPEVTQLDGGRVELRYLLNTNLFQNMALVYFSEQPCNPSLTINRNGNQGKLSIEISEKGFFRTNDLQANVSRLSLRNVTSGSKKITIKLPYTTFEQTVDLCATPNATIDLPTPPPALIDATIQVNVSCQEEKEKVRVTNIPAASIVYREEGAAPGTAWRVATDLSWDYNSTEQALTGGSCVISGVEVGKRYVLKITYDNNVEEATVPVSGTVVEYDETIDADICS